MYTLLYMSKLYLVQFATLSIMHHTDNQHRLLDSLVVEFWHRVREVPGSIPSQGPHHTKDVIKMVPVVPLFSTGHSKGKILALSQELRKLRIQSGVENPSKSEVIGRCGRDEKKEWPRRTDKSWTLKKHTQKLTINCELCIAILLKSLRKHQQHNYQIQYFVTSVSHKWQFQSCLFHVLAKPKQLHLLTCNSKHVLVDVSLERTIPVLWLLNIVWSSFKWMFDGFKYIEKF